MSTKYLNQVELKGTVTPNNSAISIGDSGHIMAEKIQGQLNAIKTTSGIIYDNGTSLQTAVVGNFPTLNQDTTGTSQYATNLSGGSAGAVPYQTDVGQTSFMTTATTAVINTDASGVPTINNGTLSAVNMNQMWTTDPTTRNTITILGSTLGNINTSATIVPLKIGGTNANLTASNGGIVFSNATKAQISSGTATAGCLLKSAASSVGGWGTHVYPSTTSIYNLYYQKNNSINAITPLRWSVLKYTGSTTYPSFTNTVPSTVNIGTANCTDPTTSSTTSINTSLSNLYTYRQGVIPTTYAATGTITPDSTITTKQAVTGASITLIAGTYAIWFNCMQSITAVAGDIGVNLSSTGFIWNTTASSVITSSSFPSYSGMVVNGSEVFSGTFSVLVIETFGVTTTLDCYVQFINGTGSSDTASSTAYICAYKIA